MKKIVLGVISVILFSCGKKVEVKELEQLNGYWQISKVETTAGDEKEYKVNENYDYFSWKNEQGMHKKVRWQPTGKFLVDDLQETVKAEVKSGDLYLNFVSSFGKHKDKVVKISKDELVLEAENGNENYYTKVTIDGKTTE